MVKLLENAENHFGISEKFQWESCCWLFFLLHSRQITAVDSIKFFFNLELSVFFSDVVCEIYTLSIMAHISATHTHAHTHSVGQQSVFQCVRCGAKLEKTKFISQFDRHILSITQHTYEFGMNSLSIAMAIQCKARPNRLAAAPTNSELKHFLLHYCHPRSIASNNQLFICFRFGMKKICLKIPLDSARYKH